MRTATLLDNQNKLIAEVALPEHMGEVKLKQYINFLKAVELPENAESHPNHVVPIAKAVSEFYDVDLQDVLQARFGKCNDAEIITAVSPLYQYTHKLIAGYKPAVGKSGDWRFRHRGVEFVMKGKSISGYDDLSTLEAYECLEAQRLFRQQEETETGDPDGSFMYSHYLKIIATLARKEGEALPFSDLERDAFTMGRMQFFSDIDAKTALDIDFFLTSILPSSEVSRKTVGFLTLRSLEVVAETKFRKPKRTRKQSNIRERFFGERATDV